MNFASLKPIAVACLIATTSISCSATDRRLVAASTEQGRASARVNLPEWPDDCRRKEPHAAIAEGAEARSVLLRERAALDLQNARTDRCTAFYDQTRGRLQ